LGTLACDGTTGDPGVDLFARAAPHRHPRARSVGAMPEPMAPSPITETSWIES
jgi:hypothetical protein